MTTATLPAPLKHIDEQRLEKDLGYRFGYLAEFVGFGPEDIEAIHASAPHLAPLVPNLVDAVYVKLFSYDATKRLFNKGLHIKFTGDSSICAPALVAEKSHIDEIYKIFREVFSEY